MMTTRILRRNTRLLIINPNSSEAMTRGMERSIRSMNLPDSLEITLYTAPPASPPSINNQQDINLSYDIVLQHLFQSPPPPSSPPPTGAAAAGLLSPAYSQNNKPPYDGILLACYSDHPLVLALQGRLPPQVAITGIFEASVVAALPLLSPTISQWGIVTTGPFWEDHLTSAVKGFLGQSRGHPNFKFNGVFSTGLTAGDLHPHDAGKKEGEGVVITPEVVRAKMKEATLALLKTGRIDCVVMGCAGMAGLEDVIRSAIKEEYDPDSADRVHIIDGVRAGVGLLEQMVRNKRMFLAA